MVKIPVFKKSKKEEGEVVGPAIMNEAPQMPGEVQNPPTVQKTTGGQWWDKLGKICLYLLFFLTPLFFLPWTVFPVALNKQILTILLVTIAGICWLLRSISSGKIIYRKSFLNVILFLLLVALGVSAYFSVARSQSLWGDLAEADSLIAFGVYIIAFFLFGAFFRKKQDLVKLTLLFMVGLAILSIFSVFQLAGQYIFPWEFAKKVSFNPIGTLFGLGIFLAFGLVMLLAMLDILRPPVWMKVAFYILAGLIGVILILLNFWVVWIGLIVAMSLMVVSKIVRRGGQAIRELSLSVIILAIAALFLIIGNKLPRFGLANLPLEISPSLSATFSIAKQNAEGLKEVVSGSGPATFAYRYALYRSQALNNTAFWGLRFSQGLGAMPTFLTVFGVIGTGLILCLFLVFLVQTVKGSKYLGGSSAYGRPAVGGQGSRGAELLTGIFFGALAGSIFLLVVWFIYPLNFTLALFTFFGMAMTLSALGRLRPSVIPGPSTSLRTGEVEGSDPSGHPERAQPVEGSHPADQGYEIPRQARDDASRQISQLTSFARNDKKRAWRRIGMFATPQRSLPLFLLSVVFIVALFAFLYLIGQKYAAAIYYHQGLITYNKGGDLDGAIGKFLQAANLDRHQPRYLRTLDEALVLRLNEVIGQSAATKSQQELDDLRVRFQDTLRTSTEAAKKANQLNGVDSFNWINYGRVYENVMFLVDGAADQAIAGYKKAMELEPKNPQLPVNLARVYVVLADRLAQSINTLLRTRPQAGQEQALRDQIQSQINLRQSFLDKAQKVLEDSITLKPDYAANHLLAAQVYDRQGKIKEAIYRAENLALIQPRDSGTMFQLGFLYYKNDDMARAQAAFERAVGLNEIYSNARYFLGLIYDQGGQKDKAIEQFQKIAELNPDNEEVQKILQNLAAGEQALEGIATTPEQRIGAPLPETGGREPEIEKESEIK